MGEPIDPAGAIDGLRAAYELILGASKAVQEYDDRGQLIATPFAFLLGGLADAVYNAADVLDVSTE